MFFLLPVGVDYRAQRYPVVTFTLMGLNVLVYLISLVLYYALGEEVEEWIYGNLWLTPSNGAWHTYFTSMFVHGGLFHLAGNMVYLFLFGSCVEDTIGRWWFILFYLAGGIVSDFTHIAAAPEHFASMVPLGGASGAISACVGGFLLLFLKTRINFRYFVFLIFKLWTGDFWLPAWLVISFWFAQDLVFAVLGAMNETTGGGVAFAAHVGGTLSGLAMIGGFKLVQKAKGPAPEPEKIPLAVRMLMEQQAPTVYLWDGSKEIGPFTDYQVRQMLQLGTVTVESFYWEEGMEDWRSMEEFGDRA